MDQGPIHQLGDLLRYQSDQEYHHRSGEHKDRHNRESPQSAIGVNPVANPKQAEDDGHRHEDLERRIQGADLEDDQEKAQAVL